jgi:hypothetical protein
VTVGQVAELVAVVAGLLRALSPMVVAYLSRSPGGRSKAKVKRGR